MRKIKNCALLLLVLSSMYSTAFAKELILSAPPRETAEAGLALYGPIAEHLTKLLGVAVTYQHPENWLEYQREMRGDKYDIIFDGPHFIAWRVKYLGHEALVKLPGKLQFILVTGKNNANLTKADDLIGKNICGISPPNLSTLSVLNYYRNPVRQPVIKGIKGGMGKVFKTLFANDRKKCHAAVLRTAFYKKKLTKEQQASVKTLFKSKAMPNQGISVSTRVSPEFKKKIIKSLSKGISSTKKLLKRFAGKAKNFIPVKAGEYGSYNMLLEGVIFGW